LIVGWSMMNEPTTFDVAKQTAHHNV